MELINGGNIRKGLVSVIVAFVTSIICGGNELLAYNHSDEEQMTVEISPGLIEAVQKYGWLGEFSEGLALVQKGSLWGFINKNGEEVIPCRYDIAYDFSEGLAVVWKDGLWGYVNKNGNSTFVDIEKED